MTAEHAASSADLSRESAASGSTVPEAAKKTLVTLMRQGVIFQAQKPKVFATICRYQTWIREHLSNVYLALSLDERQGVAFVIRADSADNAAESDFEASRDSDNSDDVSLISRRVLTLHDTLILLVLRKYYQERENAGEQKIIIDLDRLESLMTPFVPLVEHGSLERKKLGARVKELSKRKLLTRLSGEDARYEITPITRYVVNAEFLENLLSEYLRLAGEYDNGTSG